MEQPKLCIDCVYSIKDKSSDWVLRCIMPQVVKKDSWALSAASGKGHGTSCRDQREKTWPAPCGMRGAMWTPRVDNVRD